MSPKTYYNILYVLIHFWEQNNFAKVKSEPKKPVNGSISAKLVVRTSFLREVSFRGFLEIQISP